MANGTVSNNPHHHNADTTAPLHDTPLDAEDSSETDAPETTPGPWSALSQPSWPNFPRDAEGRMNTSETTRFYRMAFGMLGIVSVLHRSTELRGDQEMYEEVDDYPLSPFDEGNLQSALLVLSDELANLAETVCQRVHQQFRSPAEVE